MNHPIRTKKIDWGRIARAVSFYESKGLGMWKFHGLLTIDLFK